MITYNINGKTYATPDDYAEAKGMKQRQVYLQIEKGKIKTEKIFKKTFIVIEE